jgi:DNA polymerase elongation subunit (family B)
MSNFYSYAWQYGNNVLVRGVRDGKSFIERQPFKPVLYVRNDQESQFKGLYGENLKPIEFGDNNDCKEFLEKYSQIENYPIYGQTDLTYQYLSTEYPGEINFDLSKLNIQMIDIETTAQHGFPSVDNPIEEILLISMVDNATKKIRTWGSGEWNSVSDEVNDLDVEYTVCTDEYDLLEKFMKWWVNNYPDIISGWNSKMFDIAYLVSRIDRVFGNDAKNSLSPFNMTRRKVITINNNDTTVYDIKGVSQLDYLDLYKKFTYNIQESYKLDYIAEVELGKNKLETGFETFREFYENDWNRFIDYNIIDAKLVDELDDKMKLIELIATMTYDSKCNFDDIFSSVRTWDCLLYNHLLTKNIMIPQKSDKPSRGIKGGYVQEPIPGKYKWIVSVDATSLYPSIIMQHNLSPETFVDVKPLDCTVDSLLERKHDTSPIRERNLSMAANGYMFSREKQGLFAEITQKFFDDRQRYKGLMKKAQQEYEKTKNKKLLSDIAKYDNFQMARKIQLNSLFGAMGNKYFRYFDERIAEGITLTGQYIIRETSRAVNEFLNKFCGTEDVEYSFYTDTDSCYITLDVLVDKFLKDKSHSEIIDAIDRITEDKIEPAIAKAMKSLCQYTNAFDEKIFFKREAIADTGIWIAKKRYALNVFDNEGVRYTEPKLKVMGLEIVRSSTPGPVRKTLKQAVSLCLSGNETDLQDYVEDCWQEFKAMTPEEIAFPRTCNNIEKYRSSADIYSKGTPMHVRGSLMFNHQLKGCKLTHKYQEIQNGDKIKFVYLKEPNLIRENVIAFNGRLPPEFDLHKYVDYDTMFDKAFIEPLNTITSSLKWNTRPVATLAGLFE